jgi:hypothetical protein
LCLLHTHYRAAIVWLANTAYRGAVTPNKFIAYQERRIGRPFSQDEVECIEAARFACPGGKRDTVKAMWAALEECLPPGDFAKMQPVNA